MHTHRTFGCLLLVPSLALFGCPKEEKKMEEAAPQPATVPSDMPATEPGMPGTSTGASLGAPPFSGTIKLAEGIPAEEVKDSDVLFIMARKSANGPGPLVAVQRHANVKFPLRYEISARDLMVPATPFEGPFVVAARLDRDGDPMTKGESDLYATYDGMVVGGAEGVTLELSRPAK